LKILLEKEFFFPLPVFNLFSLQYRACRHEQHFLLDQLRAISVGWMNDKNFTLTARNIADSLFFPVARNIADSLSSQWKKGAGKVFPGSHQNGGKKKCFPDASREV
jgi:hypothetical protein